jgi:tetratricopeptide (TPR) repeat protein
MADPTSESSELRETMTVAPAGSDQPNNLDEPATLAPGQSAEPASSNEARSFGDYELLEEIARGGMGVVYRARQRSANRIVALKMILAGQLASPADVQRFRAEAEAAANLDHPQIVPIFEVGEHGGQHFFSMKFIQGGNLAEWIADSRLKIAGFQKHAASLVALVARAVHYAHQRGVLHRDLKPSNILLQVPERAEQAAITNGRSATPLITDFGLVKKVEGDQGVTQSGAIVGTPSYMAPEQARSEKTLTTAADVYSLGAILYQCLTGVPPFHAGTPLDTILQVLEREPDPPRSLSAHVDPDLETICLKCLQKEPVKRYGSAEALAEDLERWLSGEPISARPVSSAERLWRWCRRNRTVAALLGLLFLVVSGALVSTTGLWLQANQQRVLAQKEGAAATQARDQAEKNLELAQQNFALAQKAVEGTTTRIAEDSRLRESDLHRLRRDLLASAVPYYEDFVRQQSDDPKLQAQRGRAYWRLAFIRHEMGENIQAATDYERMRSIFQQLADSYPNEFVYRHDLAAGIDNLGAVLSDLGKVAEAEKAFRDAIDLAEQLLLDFPEVTSVRQELVGRYSNLGTALSSAGRLEDAEAVLRRALAIHDQSARPVSSELSEPLAASYHNLGALLDSAHKVKAAEEAFRMALKIRTQLVDALPTSGYCRQRLAMNYNSLGIVLTHSGRMKDAEATYRQALDIRERLAADFPSVPEYRRELAGSQNSLGIMLLGNHRFAEAESAFRAAIAGREKLAAEFAQAPRYAADLGGSYCNMGKLLNARQQPQAALDWYDKAILTLTAVLSRSGELAQIRNFLCNCHWGRAYTLGALHRYTDSFKDWDRALELADEADRVSIRSLRAHAWARGGLTARAVVEAADLTTKQAAADITLYDVACIYGLAAKQQPDHADANAAKAIQLLRRAHSAGYFRRPGRVDHLARDPDLDALRSRADYRQFVAELKPP